MQQALITRNRNELNEYNELQAQYTGAIGHLNSPNFMKEVNNLIVCNLSKMNLHGDKRIILVILRGVLKILYLDVAAEFF